MAKAKKQEKSIEQRLEEALVLYEKTPYELPLNWCWVKFKSIADFGMGQTILSKELKQEGVPIYSASADGEIFGYINSEDNRIKLSEGDFVIAARGTIGSIKFISAKEACCTQTTMYMKPYNKEISKYLYYAMRAFSEKIFVATGATIPQLTISSLDDKMIPLAPFEEQKRIVEIIEKQFAKLDEARDLIQKSLDSFADRKSAILHKAFTGELTKKWRESNSRKESKQRISIEEVVEINPKNKKPICDDESEVSFVPMRAVCEIKGEVKEILFEKFKKVKKGFTYFEEDDVLFAKITPCMENGKCFVASGLKNGFGFASTEFYVFRCSNKINKKYLWYILRDKSFRNKAAQVMTGAVGQQRVPKPFLEKEKIYLYDMEEQEEIVRILDSIFEKEDKSKELLDMLDKIDEMKKSILARAFRGELGTSNPTDEPAIELLKRIL